MRTEQLFPDGGSVFGEPTQAALKSAFRLSQRNAIAMLLVVALFAFEIFNFDTTRYALTNLLGDVSFARIPWAAILALAFCAIDFAGLAYLFTPDGERQSLHESWYLMGAWMLGATMNAVMTWWAVNLTLLGHQFGNEVLSREQILAIVPPFVAVLVWLTRILFIGAFSVASDHFFEGESDAASRRPYSERPQLELEPQPLVASRFGPEDEPLAQTGPATDTRTPQPKREPSGDSPQRRLRQRRPIPTPAQPEPMRARARSYRSQ